MSGLATYVIGALVSRDQIWIATTLAVISMLLLELKQFLENLTVKIPGAEILTFTKFLLLTFVILPVVPDQEYGPFAVNPFKAWLVVVAISGVSYGSYLLEKVSKRKRGLRLSAVLGGAYSSTVTTFVMAKQARGANAPHAYAGAILMASGVMYFRFLILIGLFNLQLMMRLLLPLLALGAVGCAAGWLWSAFADAPGKTEANYLTKNPLELTSAFSLALVFVILLIATNYALVHLGRTGIFSLAVLSGIAPVDPFIMGLTQSAGKETSLDLAAAAVVVAAAANNFVKGLIAYGLADKTTAKQSVALMLGLTALGLVPLFWFAH
jgi:uncharacterized membrane protein (DUF4010 family)